jgi:PPE-repeat protein
MEFTTLPPEVISALIHSGPGSESLTAAAAAWRQLGADLEDAAENYAAVVSSMADTWHGPSAAAMSQSVAPYLTWLRTTAQQAQQVAASAQAAASAFNSASAAVVPTAQVLANRTRLAQLLATNGFGRNLPAIAATEADYQRMWANNAAAMTRYQAASTQATNLPQFTSPASTTNPSAQATQSTAQTAAAANSGSSVAAKAAASASPAEALPIAGDPNVGFVGLANTYANQFISSGFPINLLSYLAQSQSAQALQGVSAQVGQGVSEGEEALGGAAANLGGGAAGALGALGQSGGGLGALGAAGLGEINTSAALGAAVPMGGLSAPPGAAGLLATSQAPVQLASAATPLGEGPGMSMMPPLMAPPISAGSGWRKRKSQKYEDISIGAELKGNVMKPPPSAG